MNQLLSFIKKEFIHIIRDKRTILILLIMPVVQIMLFGFAMTLEVKNINAAVYYHQNDENVLQIIDRISASEYFKIKKRLYNTDEINNIFKSEKIDTVIVFEDDFSGKLYSGKSPKVQIINDASDPNQASTITNYIMGIISSFQADFLEKNSIYQQNMRPILINTEIKMLYNPELKGSYNFVPGVMALVLTLICAMMTSISIVREKEFGTMELLLVSPMKPVSIILSKITPYFFISVINLITILLLSTIFLEMPIRGSLWALIFVSFLFIILSLTVGILISSLVSNQAAAMLIAGMGMMMPVMLLSGMLFPKDSMPLFLQWLSYIVPASWYFEAVKKIMIEGQSIVYVLKECLILFIMLILIITASIKKFQLRLG